jgi:hypothetical protein
MFVALATPDPAAAAERHESGIQSDIHEQVTDFSSQHRHVYGGYYLPRSVAPRYFGSYYSYGYSSPGYYGSYGPGYSYYGSYPYYRDDPPGSAFQDRSIREENGNSAFPW